MNFARIQLAAEYAKLHPKVRAELEGLAEATAKFSYPPLTLTAISRSPEFYAEHGLKTPTWSWHYPDCAADIRVRDYSQEERKFCEDWLESRCGGSEWQLLAEDHGTGPHFHLAYKDFSRRRDWEAKRNV